MNKNRPLWIIFSLSIFIIGSLVFSNANASTIIEELNNGFCSITVLGNGTIECTQYNDTMTITHGAGIQVRAFPTNKTLYFDVNTNGSGGVGNLTNVNNLAGMLNWFSSVTGTTVHLRGLNLGTGLSGSQNSNTVTLQTNFGIDNFTCPTDYYPKSFNNQTRQVTCVLIPSSGGSENTTVTNIGVGQGQITPNSPSQVGGNINLRSIANGTGIKVSQNSTTILIQTNFYVASKTCSGTDKVSSINTTSGLVLCSTDQVGITSATGQNNGNGYHVYTGSSTAGGTSTLNFNTLRAGSNVQLASNSTDVQISATDTNTAQCSNAGSGTGTLCKSNLNATNIQVKSISQGQGIKLTNNANDVNVATNFKVNNETCTAGYAVTSFSNTTGIYSCSPFAIADTNTAQGTNLGSGTHVYVGNGNATQLQFDTLGAGQGLSISVASNQISYATNFKVDNISCANNYYISAFSNSTGIYTCTALPVTSAITSLDGNGVSSQTLAGTTGQINLVDSGSTHTFSLAIKVNNQTCSAGHFVSSYDNKTGNYVCSASSSGTITGASNLGTHGTGIYSTVTSGVLNFLSALAGQGISLSSNSTNLSISTNFKVNNITCNAGYAITSYSNSTGSYTCTQFATTNTAQVVNADNGESLISSKLNATETKTMSLRNATNYMNFNHNSTSITPSFLFKVNSKTCPANNYVSALDNTTGNGNPTCTALPVTSAVTSLSVNAPLESTGSSGTITLSDSNGVAHNETYANNKGIANNTKELNFINATGFQFNIVKSKSHEGTANQAINITGTNTGVTSITGTPNNVTASASIGAITLNVGSNIPSVAKLESWQQVQTYQTYSIFTPIADPSATKGACWFSSTTNDTIKCSDAHSIFTLTSSKLVTNSTTGQLSGNGTGSSSTTLKMDGVYATITPTTTGKITVIVSGEYTNSVSGKACIIQLRESTSNMGGNQASLAGSLLESSHVTAPSASTPVGFPSRQYDFAGTVGTKYFFDLAYATNTASDTCTLTDVYWDLIEH